MELKYEIEKLKINLKNFVNNKKNNTSIEFLNILLPYTQPLTETQFNSCKQIWSFSHLPTSLSNIIYTHNNEEIEEISKIYSIMNQLNFFTILYDPINKIIIEKTDKDDINILNNPIDHPIMKLINKYSKKLSNSDENNNLNEIKNILDDSNLLGIKSEHSPYIKYLDNISLNPITQYYCENFFVFTLDEPCFMCAMALVHSRISRIYFLNQNLNKGALVSKLKINNYNLNHSYLIFKIENI